VAARLRHARAASPGLVRQLFGGTGLADAGLPDQHRHASPARQHLVQLGAQRQHHRVAPDEEPRLDGSLPGRLACIDGRDEAVAPAVNRLDRLRAGAATLQRLADGRHGGGQHGLGDVLAPPELVEELPLRHYPVAVLEQVVEQVEGLGCELDDLAAAAELEERHVELEFGEGVDHRQTLTRCRHTGNVSRTKLSK
jgi:hypothetical protein